MSRPSRRQTRQPDTHYASVPIDSPPRAHAYSNSHYYQPHQQYQPQPQAPSIPQPQFVPTQHIGGPRPKRSSNTSHDRTSRRLSRPAATPMQMPVPMPSGTAMDVARHQVGTAWGPYSYHPATPKTPPAKLTKHYSTTPSERSTNQEKATYSGPAVPAATTTTVAAGIWYDGPDLDDKLHTPDPRRDGRFTLLSFRGWLNVGGLFALVLGLLMLFIGYPLFLVITHPPRKVVGFNVGGINGSGQIPDLPDMPFMIDRDTPQDVLTRVGSDNQVYDLVFSDEFNTDGRSFYPGDDPFWEAADLHYWPTNNVEWYDPSAVTTKDGKLVITMTEQRVHDLNFQGGMLTSWNKFCFTTGYIEVSMSLPGSVNAPGLWPAAWTLGNLGRAAYGGTTQGMWPYSYDTCDTGTFPNQQDRSGNPTQASTGGQGGQILSAQPGQKLSACSCPGSDHPGPSVNVGRGVPEIDIIEAEIDTRTNPGQNQATASQSFQVAPYDMFYLWNQDASASTIYDNNMTHFNQYRGGPYQQAASALSNIRNEAFGGNNYGTYGYEYWSDPKHREDGYITWYVDGKPTWTATSASVPANTAAQIGPRLISEEPMYIILNLGMSPDFQPPDFEHMQFPVSMFVDYVRVYQRRGLQDGVTCDPPNRPTADYINRHMNVYTNPNITTWAQANLTFPRNSRYDGC